MPHDVRDDFTWTVPDIAKACYSCEKALIHCDCLGARYPANWTGRGCVGGEAAEAIEEMAEFCSKARRLAPSSCALGCDCPYLRTVPEEYCDIGYCGAKDDFNAFIRRLVYGR